MWRLGVIVFAFACVVQGSIRRSPNADKVEQYYVRGDGANRYSDNLIEDAMLDVPGLIAKYGYPVEVHKVVTEDGYVLEVQRIPHGRDRNNVPDPKKPVAFVMHGLFSSAADFVLMGPNIALAYILAEAGYDVWLGNARGTYYSRNHVSLNPDTSRDQFWRFSWNEIGTLDLPAMIDHALKVSGKSRLHYIGHSQGTTVFWVMASSRPEYNDKIISMQALAPVAYLQNNQHPLFIAIAPFADSIESVANLIGLNELLPNSPLITQAGATFCADGAVTQPICSNLILIFAGLSEDQHNAQTRCCHAMFPVKLAHTPAGIAVRQIVHYGQHIRKDFFRRYDYGSPMANWREYRSFSPPTYELNRITAPVFLHYAEVDVFAHLDDVDRLWRELGRPIAKLRVPHATFSHVDFMWGTGAKELVYDRVINLMKSVGDD